MGVTLRWLDELLMHWPDGFQILLNDQLDGATALTDVALQATDKSQVICCINEDSYIHELAERGIYEDQNSLDNNNRAWSNMNSLRATRVGRKVVDRHLDRLSRAKRPDMIGKEIVVESFRMIEVYAMAQFEGHVAHVAIVAVLLKVDYAHLAHICQYAARYRRLAGTSPTADTDDHRNSRKANTRASSQSPDGSVEEREQLAADPRSDLHDEDHAESDHLPFLPQRS